MNSKSKKSKKEQLTELYGCSCYWCRCSLSENKITLDHLLPKSLGGSDSLENLRPACFRCNNSRGNSLYPPNRILNPCFLS